MPSALLMTSRLQSPPGGAAAAGALGDAAAVDDLGGDAGSAKTSRSELLSARLPLGPFVPGLASQSSAPWRPPASLRAPPSSRPSWQSSICCRRG
eukprot:141987-Pyramimonas_sp.AAC.1